ncbi:probable E3 ubiquitin-protein ligase TRIML2 [Ochotona princeps]|uniref:probable E3 ubiquitin-protein ligase TRIML2 n=1 Tax=Ochotona princeps TaxID=9978 RepID=UPI002714EE90|nr:probable E3 ubiquitin-protein ligase TRIML2 [Ochotona princeps]
MSKTLSSQHIPEDAYCEVHLEPPQLFCEDDQVALCSKCSQSQEHKHHLVYGIQEAADNYRNSFQEMLNTLREKLEVAKSVLADEQERMVMIQEEEQNFKRMIESEYRTKFHLLSEENYLNSLKLEEYMCDSNLREASVNLLAKFGMELEEKSREMLQRLTVLGRENMNKLKESEARVSEQICSIQSIITELSNKCEEPAFTVLQNARHILERSKSLVLQCLQPALITEMSLCHIKGMSKMLRVLQRNITLDPEAAHACLVLSEDRRTMRCGSTQQAEAGHPERFDFGAMVLGVECFTSGQHYWEVDVGKATKWQLGVCRDSAQSKDSKAGTPGERVLLMGAKMGAEYTFWVFPPLQKVPLKKQILQVGVFLDYKYGQVSFYDAMEGSLIYNFSCLPFQGALKPVFSLCIPNGSTDSDTLTVCLPRVPS